MSDEMFALTLQGAPPSEAAYEAIHDAVMDSARGRWFLIEYARRNRHADTEVLLAALGRIENALIGSHAVSPSPAATLHDAIAAAKSNLAAIKPDEVSQGKGDLTALGRALKDAAARIRAATEQVQDIVWSMRDAGDPMQYDRLDRAATEIAQACALLEALQEGMAGGGGEPSAGGGGGGGVVGAAAGDDASFEAMTAKAEAALAALDPGALDDAIFAEGPASDHAAPVMADAAIEARAQEPESAAAVAQHEDAPAPALTQPEQRPAPSEETLASPAMQIPQATGTDPAAVSTAMELEQSVAGIEAAPRAVAPDSESDLLIAALQADHEVPPSADAEAGDAEMVPADATPIAQAQQIQIAPDAEPSSMPQSLPRTEMAPQPEPAMRLDTAPQPEPEPQPAPVQFAPPPRLKPVQPAWLSTLAPPIVMGEGDDSDAEGATAAEQESAIDVALFEAEVIASNPVQQTGTVALFSDKTAHEDNFTEPAAAEDMSPIPEQAVPSAAAEALFPLAQPDSVSESQPPQGADAPEFAQETAEPFPSPSPGMDTTPPDLPPDYEPASGPADFLLEPWPRVSSNPEAATAAEDVAEAPQPETGAPAPAVTATALPATLAPEPDMAAPIPSAAKPVARPPSRPAPSDPLAPIMGLSEEEKIALFS